MSKGRVGLSVALDPRDADSGAAVTGYQVVLPLTAPRKRRRRRRREGPWARALRGPRHGQWGERREVLPVSLEDYFILTDGAHPAHGELWTPITPQMVELLYELKAQYRTWRMLAAVSDFPTRYFRRWRAGGRVCVSMRVWDRLLTAVDREYLLEEYLWFTPEDLIRMGLWKPLPLIVGKERYMLWDSDDDGRVGYD